MSVSGRILDRLPAHFGAHIPAVFGLEGLIGSINRRAVRIPEGLQGIGGGFFPARFFAGASGGGAPGGFTFFPRNDCQADVESVCFSKFCVQGCFFGCSALAIFFQLSVESTDCRIVFFGVPLNLKVPNFIFLNNYLTNFLASISSISFW